MQGEIVGQHSVTTFMEEENTGFDCTFTGVYAPCDRKIRRSLWKEMGAIYGLISQPWVIVGDFNVVRFEAEKEGNARSTRAMREFSRLIDDLSLLDPPLHGGKYTWFRGGNSTCASRIDRILFC